MNMNPNERNGRENGNITLPSQTPALPPLNTPPMFFPPYEIQSHFGFMNSFPRLGGAANNPPATTFKRLIVQIGCQQSNAVGKNQSNHKRFPKMLKAINDPDLTVEDWLYDLLSKDISAKELRNLFDSQKGIITGNSTAATLTLCLGPNRSIQIAVVKEKTGLKYKKGPINEVTGGNKRKRRESKPKSLKLQLVTSESDVLLCPRDPIYQLIGSTEEVVLQLAGEGGWESQDNDGSAATATAARAAAGGGNVDTPVPAENETQPEESRPAKRQKTQKQPPEPQEQTPAPSTPKRLKTEKPKEEKVQKTDNDEEDGQKSKKASSRKAKTNATNDATKPKSKNLTANAQKKEQKGDKNDKEASQKAKTASAQKSKTKKNNNESKSTLKKPTIETKKKGNDCDKEKKQKSKNASSLQTKTKIADQETRQKQENLPVDAKKKEASPPGSGDRDILIGNLPVARESGGYSEYCKCIESNSYDFADHRNRKQIVDEVKSKFRFFWNYGKGSDSWVLLKSYSSVIENKVKRDLLNHLKRNKTIEDVKKERKNEEEKVVDEKVTGMDRTEQEAGRDVNEDNSDDSSSHQSDEEEDSESDDQGDDPPRKVKDDYLSDETTKVEKEKVEILKNRTNEKSEEERISARTFEDKPSSGDRIDGDGANGSSSLKVGISTGSGVEKNGLKKLAIQPQKDDGVSQKSIDDDSSSGSSEVSSTSSSSVSSSSDDDSSSSSSGSDDSSDTDDDKPNSSYVARKNYSDTNTKKESKLPREVNTKSSPNIRSSQKQQNTKRSKRRKPLLDPNQKLVFLQNSRDY